MINKLACLGGAVLAFFPPGTKQKREAERGIYIAQVGEASKNAGVIRHKKAHWSACCAGY